jgi:hypothetical protein
MKRLAVLFTGETLPNFQEKAQDKVALEAAGIDNPPTLA